MINNTPPHVAENEMDNLWIHGKLYTCDIQ